jgi:hypothetical protein
MGFAMVPVIVHFKLGRRTLQWMWQELNNGIHHRLHPLISSRCPAQHGNYFACIKREIKSS